MGIESIKVQSIFPRGLFGIKDDAWGADGLSTSYQTLNVTVMSMVMDGDYREMSLSKRDFKCQREHQELFIALFSRRGFPPLKSNTILVHADKARIPRWESDTIHKIKLHVLHSFYYC